MFLLAIAVTWDIWLFTVLVLTMFIVYGIRIIFPRQRPHEKIDYSNLFKRVDTPSFPSMHAARVSALGFYLFPELWMVPVTAVVCWTRILLRKHHLSDVVVGYVLGALIAQLIFKLNIIYT